MRYIRKVIEIQINSIMLKNNLIFLTYVIYRDYILAKTVRVDYYSNTTPSCV